MSDTSDDMAAKAQLYEAHMEMIEETIDKRKWETKDGKILSFEDMTTSHIENCIRMLTRNRTYMGDGFISVFNSELKRRDSLSIEGGFNCL